MPKSTKVDSPIDEAIQNRQGVCQDFAHIMIALVRSLRIPCRYVSGYLYRRSQDHDRSVADATHAWVEALLPPLGWVGFDPTNCLLAGDRHIRTAIGRDYADVPPTRGIFRGHTASDLSVAVRVTASADAPELDQVLPVPEEWSVLVEKAQEPPPPPVKTMRPGAAATAIAASSCLLAHERDARAYIFEPKTFCILPPFRDISITTVRRPSVQSGVDQAMTAYVQPGMKRRCPGSCR